MKVSVCQINPVVGDISSNCARITAMYRAAYKEGADIAVFPELAITGYSPEDLVLRPRFRQTAMEETAKLAHVTKEHSAVIITGGIEATTEGVYNSVFVLAGGDVRYTGRKWALPNYGVFDEKRVFDQGALPQTINLCGMKIGLVVCEDMWRREVSHHLASSGLDLAIVINASPYEVGKRHIRTAAAQRFVQTSKTPLLYVNQVGGQDELVFDGNSFFMDVDGVITHSLPGFTEHQEVVEIVKTGIVNPLFREFAGREESIYSAMTLGLRDYVNKNGFGGVVLGLSGGIDSALSAAVAVDALGEERVRGVMLPSRYTSKESINDARDSARLLGIRLNEISIEEVTGAAALSLSPLFAGLTTDATEENIQSRARAILLMALSNKFGLMLLTTGNKSEMSVGYATLYGDLCGGYSVLKDVYKTTVYTLSHYRNNHLPLLALGRKGRVIPEHSIIRPPSAELKPNQLDQDTLPPYDVLDKILEMLIDRQMSSVEIEDAGFAKAVVRKVVKMVYAAEYKRRQAPPGVKLTNMAFGRDRRYPITNRFVE